MSLIIRLFPVWAVVLSTIAYFFPVPFSGLKTSIIPLLSVVMFGMGMTLTWQHFLKTFRQPGIIGCAIIIQFLFMPFFAFFLSKMFALSTDQLVGMILVGSSAGGTASNVICYLAKGDVALSILLTTTSTLFAVVAMPALTHFYLHQTVPVPFMNMLISILQIVLVPVFIGTAINSMFGRYVDKVRLYFPLISALAIVVIIAIIVATNRQSIAQTGLIITVTVALHNLMGLTTGYYLPKLFGYDIKTCRTVSIEVGMQNSGLSVALAIKYFSPMAALPGAIFSIWHNISGSVLASFWGGISKQKR